MIESETPEGETLRAEIADAILRDMGSNDPLRRNYAWGLWDGAIREMEAMMEAATANAPSPKMPDRGVGRREWFRQRAARDPGYRLNRNIRHAVNQSLAGTKRGRKWQSLVGYTIDELRAHLEPLFADGMTWDNYGQWHLDHVRPLSSFNIFSAECDDFKAAWALSNLQPLWAKDNLRKHATWKPPA